MWMVHGFPSLLFIHTSVDVCVDGTWVPQPIVYNTSVDVSVDGTWVPQPIVYTYFSGCLCGWYMGSPAYCLYILQWMSLWMVHGFPSLLFIHTSVDVCVDGTWVPQPIVYTYFSGCLCGWYMGSLAYCLYILQWMSVWMVHGFPSLLFIHTSVDVCVDGTWVPQPIVYTYFSGCLCGWYMGSPAYCLYILQWMSVWMVHGFPSLLFIHTSVDVCVDGTWVP